MSKKEITLTTLPISTNALYRGRRFLTSKGKSTKEAMGWEAKQQWRGGPLTGSISLKIELWRKNKQRYDIDNVLKSLLDSLTGIIYEDDSQITSLHITKGVDKEYPRCEIMVQSTV